MKRQRSTTTSKDQQRAEMMNHGREKREVRERKEIQKLKKELFGNIK